MSKNKQNQVLDRYLPIGEIRAQADNERVLTISFSSEEPYLRWGDLEILDHSAGAVDLTRLNEIGVLLFNHDRGKVIGKIRKAWLENLRGVAEVEFDTDEDSDLIFQKVQNQTLKGVSVGYKVDSWEFVSAGAISADGRFKGPADIGRKWTPLEISIVSVPADPTVGVGRDIENEEEKNMGEKNQLPTEATTAETINGATGIGALPQGGAINGTAGTRTASPQGATTGETVITRGLPQEAATTLTPQEIQQSIQRSIQQERERTAGIMELCRSFGVDSEAYIKEGKTLDEAKSGILEHLQKTQVPVSIRVQHDEGDKYRDAASNSLLLRAGIKPEKEAPGANEFRCMSLRELAIDSLEREGVAGARRMDNDMLLRQFFNPVSAFPSILDNTIEKAYVQGYNTVNLSFDKYTSKGTLPDFKETRSNYLAGPAGEFLLVPETGELKHDTPVDGRTPTRRLHTYGRKFSMSRQAFVNDDIGYLTTLPARYAAAAKRTINKQVCEVLLNNPTMHDGRPIFDSNKHKNLVSTGTGFEIAAVEKMLRLMQLQKDEWGNAIIVEPKYLVMPVGYGFAVQILLDSPTINTPGNTQAINPLHNRPFVVVEDSFLNSLIKEGDPLPWFLIANQNSVGTIQVDYLNGQEIPTIRRMETAGQLGFMWDIYLDWGVTVLDYRGMVKNPGIPIPVTA